MADNWRLNGKVLVDMADGARTVSGLVRCRIRWQAPLSLPGMLSTMDSMSRGIFRSLPYFITYFITRQKPEKELNKTARVAL
jgi:pantothenate kinase type III